MNRSIHRWLFAVLILGISIRLIALLILTYLSVNQLENIAYGGDAVGYTQLATNLINEHVYKFTSGDATSYRMPGYPLFLLFFYMLTNNWLSVQLIQVFFDTVTAYVVFKTAEIICGDRKSPAWITLLVILNPLLIISAISLLPETITVCLMTIAVFILVKYASSEWIKWIIPVIFGTATYLKPSVLFVEVIVFIIYIFYLYDAFKSLFKSLSTLLIMICVFVLILTPWIIRNYIIWKTFIPLTTSDGSNLYGGNNPQADGGYVSSEPYVLTGMSEPNSDQVLTQRAMTWIRLHPDRFIALLPAKAARFLWPLSLGTSASIALPRVIFWTIFILILFFYSFVMFGFLSLLISRKYWHVAVLFALPLGLIIPALIAFGAARFALPAFPAMGILGAVGVEKMIIQIRILWPLVKRRYSRIRS